MNTGNVLCLDAQGDTTRSGATSRPARIADSLKLSGVTVTALSLPVDTTRRPLEGIPPGCGPTIRDSKTKSFATIGVLNVNLEILSRCVAGQLDFTANLDAVVVHDFECIIAAEVIARRANCKLVTLKAAVLANHISSDALNSDSIEDNALLQYALDLEDYAIRKSDRVVCFDESVSKAISARWNHQDNLTVEGVNLLHDVRAFTDRSESPVSDALPGAERTTIRIGVLPGASRDHLDEVAWVATQLARDGRYFEFTYFTYEGDPSVTTWNERPALPQTACQTKSILRTAINNCDIVISTQNNESGKLHALDSLNAGVVSLQSSDEGAPYFATHGGLPFTYLPGTLLPTIERVVRQFPSHLRRLEEWRQHQAESQPAAIDALRTAILADRWTP